MNQGKKGQKIKMGIEHNILGLMGRTIFCWSEHLCA
jgi:hypothetical protein